MTSRVKPLLIIVAGPNGAGKTSITERLLMHQWMQGCVYINPDLIARDEFGDWNCRESVLKAAQQAEEIREACLRDGVSFAFETVLSTQNKIDFIQRAMQSGFFVRLFFIGTDDPSINAKRVAVRVMEGGHDVPITKIIQRYARSLANCSVCRKNGSAHLYLRQLRGQCSSSIAVPNRRRTNRQNLWPDQSLGAGNHACHPPPNRQGLTSGPEQREYDEFFG